MEKLTGEALANSCNLGEVSSWRLHWLTCDLHNLMRDMRKADFSRQALSTGIFGDFQGRFKSVIGNYSQLRWETKTILGNDYYDQVDVLFAHVTKHADYLEAVEEVKNFLMETAAKLLDAEKARVLQDVVNDAKPLVL